VEEIIIDSKKGPALEPSSTTNPSGPFPQPKWRPLAQQNTQRVEEYRSTFQTAIDLVDFGKLVLGKLFTRVAHLVRRSYFYSAHSRLF
jgi:hypothetical protein